MPAREEPSVPTDATVHLHVTPETVPALLFALAATRDDLAARAIVAAAHDPDLGRHSAAEYLADVDRLANLLTQLGVRPRPADPERAAVRWLDGTWTVEDDRPVQLAPRTDRSRTQLHKQTQTPPTGPTPWSMP